MRKVLSVLTVLALLSLMLGSALAQESPWQGKTVLVTGANRGIGFETCRQLAKRDVQVILTSRDQARGRAAGPVPGRSPRTVLGGCRCRDRRGRQRR